MLSNTSWILNTLDNKLSSSREFVQKAYSNASTNGTAVGRGGAGAGAGFGLAGGGGGIGGMDAAFLAEEELMGGAGGAGLDFWEE